MEYGWFWLLVILVLIATFAWPSWPYTRQRGLYRRGGSWPYAPSAAAGAGVLLIFLFFWLGLLVIAWPWAATPVVVN